MENEVRKLKKTLNFLQENRKVAVHNLMEYATERNRDNMLWAIERLDYAAEGVRRLLKDAETAEKNKSKTERVQGTLELFAELYNNANDKEERDATVAQFASEYEQTEEAQRTLWARERRSLQKRIGEQRKQLDGQMKDIRKMRELVQRMAEERKRLLEDNVRLRHSKEQPVCEGCPLAENCTEYSLTQ